MAGFYGNATSSAKVNLTFDIVYPNRVKMEKEAAGDGVYIGRYVLVEYGNSSIADNTDSLQLLYRDASNNFYYDTSKTVQWSGTTDSHTMYKVLGPSFWRPSASLPADQQYEVWVRISDPSDKSKDTLKLVTSATSGALGYASNYGIDKEAYALGNDAFRGFDSTVWQKTFADGESKYVMIAELNSVVPTFNIKVDAPSQIPNPPHFDSNKTNVYYDMHLQPSWGFRIKKAADGLSDVTGAYDTYDKDSKTISSNDKEKLDIYFYKEGLREWPEGDTRNTEVVLDNNYILMRGAKSGYLYESHDVTNPVAEQDDIQELSIQLPAIGQMVKKGWDIVHGSKRDNSPIDSLEGRLKFFRGDSYTNSDGTVVGGLKQDEVPLQSADMYLVGAKPTGDNKWIRADVNASSRRFYISHIYDPTSLVNTKEVSTSTFNHGHNPADTTYSLEDDGEFSYSTPVVDEMGHVIGAHDYRVTLPNSLQNIMVIGSRVNSTPSAGASGTIKSSGYKDLFTLKPYDQWITLTADPNNKSIAIGHAAGIGSSITGNVKSSNNTAPDFGESIKVLTISTDETGHISNASSYDIKLPKPSLEVKEKTSSLGSKVIIGASLTAATGKLSLQNANVGELALTKYDDSVSTHSNKIQATDTINEAFNKSQANLDAEILRADTAEKALGKRIDDLDVTDAVNAAQYVSSVSQTDGKITVVRGNVGTLTLTGYTLPTSVNNYGKLDAAHSVNEAFGRLEYRINETQQTINDLDYSDTVDNTKIITSVSQTDGKITVTRDNAGTLILGPAYSPSAGALISGNDNLYTAISTLEHSVHTLTTNLNTLINDGDPTTLNSVADLITWVGDHGDTVKDITDRISQNAEAIGVDEIQDESGNVTQAASGIKKELLDLRELMQTREISITSDQGETLIGTVEEVLSGMLTRMSALEEICAIHPLDPPGEEELPTE